MSLPPFNPHRAEPKSDPGKGDDEPCRACGAVALDTGLECSECGADNWEAITGKPHSSALPGSSSSDQPRSPLDHTGAYDPFDDDDEVGAPDGGQHG